MSQKAYRQLAAMKKQSASERRAESSAEKAAIYEENKEQVDASMQVMRESARLEREEQEAEYQEGVDAADRFFQSIRNCILDTGTCLLSVGYTPTEKELMYSAFWSGEWAIYETPNYYAFFPAYNEMVPTYDTILKRYRP